MATLDELFQGEEERKLIQARTDIAADKAAWDAMSPEAQAAHTAAIEAKYTGAERPSQPKGEDSVWYRGWEVGFDYLADHWSNNGWRAYKGGVDLDAPNVDAASFTAVLDAVDDEEDE